MTLLHTMFRVRDLDRSIKFYTEVLGMTLFRRTDYPSGEFTLAFLGYGKDPDDGAVELTYNWDNRTYELGNAFGHIAIGVDDIYKMCDEIKRKGGTVTREPGPMKHGTTMLAFVKDPDGYFIELIQR